MAIKKKIIQKIKFYTPKKLLIFATLLIVLGAFMAILPACDSNFFTKNYQSATHEITEQFDSISMSTDTADIKFLKSEDQTCKVVCYENKLQK